MPRIRTLQSKKAPEGWDEVSPQLEEFQQQMKDAVNEPHEGKRRNEATWPITKIHYERSRYIYELFYKKKAISRELYDFLLREKWGDAALIAKWKKPGYEYLCSLQAIDKKGTHFGTNSICRVPLHLRKPGPQGAAVNTGCIACSSTEAGRLGGPIWWDSPRPSDLIGWAKAGCPTEDKPAKKRKLVAEGEDAELEARAKALRRGKDDGSKDREANELEGLGAALRAHEGGGEGLKVITGDDGPGSEGGAAGVEGAVGGSAAAAEDNSDGDITGDEAPPRPNAAGDVTPGAGGGAADDSDVSA